MRISLAGINNNLPQVLNLREVIPSIMIAWKSDLGHPLYPMAVPHQAIEISSAG